MILLADNEIRQELDKLPNGNLFLPSAYEETSIAWNEFVARAQLKKVYELVSPYLYDTRGGWILEVLKKEAGG